MRVASKQNSNFSVSSRRKTAGTSHTVRRWILLPKGEPKQRVLAALACDLPELLLRHGLGTAFPDRPVDASQIERISSSFDFGFKEMLWGRTETAERSFMDKKKLDYFRKRLETRQQELRRTVTRTQQDGRSADEDSAQDIADRAASSYNKEFLFSQSNNERQLLQMVESALVRIRQGNFGECISCGREINPKRLEAVPWTRHCIECQEKLEQGLLEETPR